MGRAQFKSPACIFRTTRSWTASPPPPRDSFTELRSRLRGLHCSSPQLVQTDLVIGSLFKCHPDSHRSLLLSLSLYISRVLAACRASARPGAKGDKKGGRIHLSLQDVDCSEGDSRHYFEGEGTPSPCHPSPRLSKTPRGKALCGGGLDENAHRLLCLNTWFPVGTVQERLEGMALLEELCHLR